MSSRRPAQPTPSHIRCHRAPTDSQAPRRRALLKPAGGPNGAPSNTTRRAGIRIPAVASLLAMRIGRVRCGADRVGEGAAALMRIRRLLISSIVVAGCGGSDYADFFLPTGAVRTSSTAATSTTTGRTDGGAGASGAGGARVDAGSSVCRDAATWTMGKDY